jgi:hypothetical protein
MGYFHRYSYPLTIVAYLCGGSSLLFLYVKATQFIARLPSYLLAVIFITYGGAVDNSASSFKYCENGLVESYFNYDVEAELHI